MVSQTQRYNLLYPAAGWSDYLFRYNLKINSTALVDKLIHEKSVLVVPGDHFKTDQYIRIGYGSEEKHLLRGLDLIGEALLEVKNAESQ